MENNTNQKQSSVVLNSKRFFMIILMISIFSHPLMALDYNMDIKAFKKRMKEAYKLRVDIDRKVLAKTAKWPLECGIIHSDWIECLNGKSIDLQGNELFPQYEYNELKLYCKNYFVMTVKGHKGVVKRDGKQLTDFKYDHFDFTKVSSGFFMAFTQKDSPKIDIYSVEGRLIHTLNNAIWAEASYLPNENLLNITYENTNKERLTKKIFPDGKSESDQGNHPKLTIMDFAEVYSDDLLTLMNDPIGRQVMTPITDNYGNSSIKQALFMLEYYNEFERSRLISPESYPNLLLLKNLLSCYYQQKNYEKVLNILNGTDPAFRPLPFKFDLAKKEAQLNDLQTQFDDTFSSVSSPAGKFGNCADTFKELYSNSLDGMKGTLTLSKLKENEQRRQQRKSALNAAIGFGIGQVFDLNPISGSSSSSSAKSSASSSAKKKKASSSGNNDEKDVEFEDIEMHEKCPVCDGKGYCKSCGGKGTKIYTAKRGTEVCASCNGSPKCKSCDGRGYHIRYTHKRK